MLVMGEPSSVSSHMVIACNGQGPVVSAEPTSLDFGEVKVLEEKTMEFQLINDSPIPTQFIATLVLFLLLFSSIVILQLNYILSKITEKSIVHILSSDTVIRDDFLILLLFFFLFLIIEEKRSFTVERQSRVWWSRTAWIDDHYC